MRLLNVYSFEFAVYRDPEIPQYAAASHRWIQNQECLYKDIQKRRNKDKLGWNKVQGFATFIKAYLPNVSHLWIDTCCVNQESSQEVTEAINSMFKWYSRAAICLAYLHDVPDLREANLFADSEWFQRGWTLQELIAPSTVLFLSRSWQTIGHKGIVKPGIELGPNLEKLVSNVTQIPVNVLHNHACAHGRSVEEKLGWLADRKTTLPEDSAYCLMGLLDVNMPLLYGEGRQRAMQRLLTLLSTTSRSIRITPAQYSLFNVPFSRDPDFVNRQRPLDEVRRRITTLSRRAALVGMGGVGKSQIAIETAYRFKQEQEDLWVFWIHASSEARFEEGLQDALLRLGLSEREGRSSNALQTFRNWLRDVEHRWLLILDNIDDGRVLLEVPAGISQPRSTERRIDYLPVCKHGSTLMTTRSRMTALGLVEDQEIVMIGPMSVPEASSLVSKKLGTLCGEVQSAELSKALDFMPLAISQAAAYIKQRAPRVSLQRYLDLVRANEKVLLRLLSYEEEQARTRRDRHAKNSIISTWNVSFEYIRKTRPSAGNLLALMSFFDARDIPERSLKIVISTMPVRQRESQSTESMVIDSRVNDDYEILEKSMDFEDDIVLLRDYSMVTVREDCNFAIHSLVQLAVRQWLKVEGQYDHYAEDFIRRVHASFPNTPDYRRVKEVESMYPHVKAAANYCPQAPELTLVWADLMVAGGSHAQQLGSFAEAEKMVMQGLEVFEKLLGERNEQTLQSRNMLALIKMNRGQLREAEALFKDVYNIESQQQGQERPQSLIALSNLANVYRLQRKFDAATETAEFVFNVGVKCIGLRHPNTLMAMNNLAAIWCETGLWHEAEAAYRRLVELAKEILGESHPDTLTAMENAAIMWHKQGQASRALDMHRHILLTRIHLFGHEHQAVVSSLVNVADCCKVLKQQTEAYEHLNEALRIQRKTLIDEAHPGIIHIQQKLAALKTCEDLRITSLTEDSETEGTAVASNILMQRIEAANASLSRHGSNELTFSRDVNEQLENDWILPVVVTTQPISQNLSTSLDIIRKPSLRHLRLSLQEAKSSIEEQLRERIAFLGNDHASTLSTMARLAVICSKTKDPLELKRSQELEEQVYEGRRRLLGLDHPHTIVAMVNLSCTYFHLNPPLLNKAEELEEAVLEVKTRLLGREHEETLVALTDLALTKARMGGSRLNEARQLMLEAAELSVVSLGITNPDTIRRMQRIDLWQESAFTEAVEDRWIQTIRKTNANSVHGGQ